MPPKCNDCCSISFSDTIVKTSKRNIIPCICHKKTNGYILSHAILSIIDMPSISVKARPAIFVRLIEYLWFWNRSS
jgi:hypothetical protein